MSDLDHRSPELDRAFGALTADLASRPGGPGAAAAVSAVGRRRRTTLAAVAVAAGLAVVGATLQLAPGPESSRVATAAVRPLPSPAAFAVPGWTPAEGAAPRDLPGASTCLAGLLFTSAEEPLAGGQVRLGRDGQVLWGSMADHAGDPGPADWVSQQATRVPAPCDEQLSAQPYEDGGTVWHLDVADDRGSAGYWFAVLDDRIGFVTVTDGGARPADVAAVSDALMAALQAPETWIELDPAPGPGASSSSGTARPEPSGPMERLYATDVLDRALRGRLPDAPAPGLAGCVDPQWTSGGASGSSGQVGGATVDVAAWDDARAADDVLAAVLARLEACGGRSTRVADHAWVVVADAGTVWVSEHGSAVGTLVVPDLAAPPPTVARDVAGLLTDAVSDADRRD